MAPVKAIQGAGRPGAKWLIQCGRLCRAGRNRAVRNCRGGPLPQRLGEDDEVRLACRIHIADRRSVEEKTGLGGQGADRATLARGFRHTGPGFAGQARRRIRAGAGGRAPRRGKQDAMDRAEPGDRDPLRTSRSLRGVVRSHVHQSKSERRSPGILPPRTCQKRPGEGTPVTPARHHQRLRHSSGSDDRRRFACSRRHTDRRLDTAFSACG